MTEETTTEEIKVMVDNTIEACWSLIYTNAKSIKPNDKTVEYLFCARVVNCLFGSLFRPAINFGEMCTKEFINKAEVLDD